MRPRSLCGDETATHVRFDVPMKAIFQSLFWKDLLIHTIRDEVSLRSSAWHYSVQFAHRGLLESLIISLLCGCGVPLHVPAIL